MPRACLGKEEGPLCSFGKDGRPAQPKVGNQRCSWCDPEALQRSCGNAGGRARLKQLLRNMSADVRRLALQRLADDVYEAHFEAEFGARAVGTLGVPEAEEDADEEVLSEASGPAAEEADLATVEPDFGDVIAEATVDRASHAEEEEEDLFFDALVRIVSCWYHFLFF